MNVPKWFDKNLLCDTDVLFNRYKKYKLEEDEFSRRLFFDNNSNLLIVCHADTVIPPRLNGMLDFGFEKRIYACGLDDRLGIMIAFQMKKKFDILICDYEEDADSTAQYHVLKRYNWIVELDRGGIDYVHYGLASRDLINDIEDTIDIDRGNGSFSDISFMKTNICRFNLGVGYYHPHDIDSYCIVEEVDLTIDRLNALYDALHSKSYCLPHMNETYKEMMGVTKSTYKSYSYSF